MTDPSLILVGCAAEIADWRRVWLALLEEHTEDGDGRCCGCRSAVRPAPRWPCRIAVLATTAQALHDRKAVTDRRPSAPDRQV